VPTGDANHDRVAVPHGVYPARGDDRWVALSVWGEDDWLRFRDALGDPHWARDGSLSNASGRRARETEIDAHIADWTRARDREEIVAVLRARGLRAAPVESIGELFDDPQLAFRGVWRRAPHAGLGEVGLMAPPFALSATPARSDRAGPTLGEHNEAVFKGLLGLSATEFASLAADGVFA
jgi:benzylsuccinate CoA-transferase BbsF subunit